MFCFNLPWRFNLVFSGKNGGIFRRQSRPRSLQPSRSEAVIRGGPNPVMCPVTFPPVPPVKTSHGHHVVNGANDRGQWLRWLFMFQELSQPQSSSWCQSWGRLLSGFFEQRWRENKKNSNILWWDSCSLSLDEYIFGVANFQNASGKWRFRLGSRA